MFWTIIGAILFIIFLPFIIVIAWYILLFTISIPYLILKLIAPNLTKYLEDL